VSEAPETSSAEVRLRLAPTLPEILDASFDAFEVIRITARSCQGQIPGMFAAFMTAADAAVDGREALTTAPSLPATAASGPAAQRPRTPTPARPPASLRRSPERCASV
jgi:hypothetical protein